MLINPSTDMSAGMTDAAGMKIKPPPMLAEFTTTQVLGVPILAAVIVLFALVMSVVLNRTFYGRSVLAIGGAWAACLLLCCQNG